MGTGLRHYALNTMVAAGVRCLVVVVVVVRAQSLAEGRWVVAIAAAVFRLVFSVQLVSWRMCAVSAVLLGW
jgi:hypothetical protein